MIFQELYEDNEIQRFFVWFCKASWNSRQETVGVIKSEMTVEKFDSFEREHPVNNHKNH